MLPARRSPHDREIVRLALPAFGALAAEPLYILVDTAIVGHLGTNPLAGTAVAGTVLPATVAIFHFLSSWNDLWGPLIFLNSEKNMTVTFGLTLLRGKYGTMAGHSGSIMAGALLGVVPMLILYFVGQRYFVQGLARTGLKG